MNERLTIAAGTASTDPEAVWALLEDVNRYSDWVLTASRSDGRPPHAS
jgi:hypothetical protein